MRWSYKTVHYELKKEGLLGNTFLDEAEVEESLNEFGHAGWELVSLIEVKDGLIGVLKQPLDQPVVSNVIRDESVQQSKPVAVEVVEDYVIAEEDEYLSEESENNRYVNADHDVEMEQKNVVDSDLNEPEEYQVDREPDNYDSYEDTYESDEREEIVTSKEREIGKIRIE